MRLPESFAEQWIHRVASEYESRGYEIHVAPSPSKFGLPPDFRPDLVAIRPGNRVAIVILARPDIASRRLSAYSEVLPSLGWQLEVVVANPPPATSEPPLEPIEPQVAKQKADEALMLLQAGHPEAALLLAWAALEASIRRREPQLDRHVLSTKGLYADGVLTQRQFSTLEAARRLRSAVAHGQMVGRIDDDLVRYVAQLASKLSDPERPTASEMVEWFLDQFEGPEHNVPFDSGEGGYQYLVGPLDARDELEAKFPNADPADIDDAVSTIENEGTEWVPIDLESYLEE
jgi:hypothetical protein